jgi:mono/diheme cytochrome c family protein
VTATGVPLPATARRAGWPAHRGATIVVFLVVASLAFTLLFIGASSPYTHANLNAAFDEGYTRTEQIVVGPPVAFGGLARPVAGGDAVTRGASLFLTEGCFGCHGLAAQGGAVAKPIAGVDRALLAQRIREGTPGMPQFALAGLTDDQLADISAYLLSLPPVK